MSLSAVQIFYAEYTKSGSGGVTGKSGSINFHLKKLTRASTPTITTITTGGSITVGSVTEVDSTNAPGLYVVCVTGLDPSADYLANFHYTSSATEVDQVDVPSLWSEFSMAINGGAVPQAQAAAVDGLATLVIGDGTTPVVPSQPTSFGGDAIAADVNGNMMVGVSSSYAFEFNAGGLPIASVGGYESNQSPDYYVLLTAGQKLKTNASGFVYSFDTGGNALATASALSTLQTSVNNLNNLSALAVLYVPGQMEIPASGSIAYELIVLIKDAEGHMLDLSASPTITATNAAGTDRSANLSSVTHAGMGQYTLTYAVGNSAVQESVYFKASGTASGDATSRVAYATVAIVADDTTTTLAAIEAQTNKIGTNNADSPNALTAQASAATLLTRIPGTVQPQTGDSYARLGAPAGASVSADIAAVETSVGSPMQAGTAVTLTTGTHTAIATDVQAGLTSQGYTTARAGYLDTLNGIVAAIATAVWSAATRTLTAISDSPTVIKLLTMLTGSGPYQFTTNALANAPSGGGGGGGTVNIAITPLQASFANPIPCRKALDVTQYSAQAFVFVFNNLDGTPTNLAGHTLQFVAATSAGTTVITYSTGTGNLVIGGTDNNNVTLTFAPADTATAQPLTYTLWDVTEDGEPVPLAGDRCTINSAVAPT